MSDLTIRLLAATLIACLLATTAVARTSDTINTTGADCIGVVTDLMPSIRKDGQIWVDGVAVVIRDDQNRPRVDREKLKRQCGEDRKIVKVRVARA
jgi:hypothetical protein